MKRFILLICFFQVCTLITTAQSKLVYEDLGTYYNWVTDIIETGKGDFVYVGSYKLDDSLRRGYISVISKEGELLHKYIDNIDCLYSRFESVNLTNDGTYIVTGGESAGGLSYTVIMEFDDELRILWKKKYKVSDCFSSVYRHRVKVSGDKNYCSIFMECPDSAPIDEAKCYIMRFNRSGELLNMTTDDVHQNVLFEGPSDVVPIDRDGDFFVLSVLFALRYNSNLELVDKIDLLNISQTGYRKVNLFLEVAGKSLNDGRVVVGGVDVNRTADRKSGLLIAELDEEKGIGKYCKRSENRMDGIFPKYRAYSSEKKSLDFVDQNNIIVGGSLNCFDSGFDRPYFTKPTTIGLVSFDSDFNVNWEEYYEDEEYSYYMMAMCATKDGGAVITALKSIRDHNVGYDEQYASIAIFKFRGDEISVEELGDGKSVMKMYPNPAVDYVNVEVSDMDLNGLRLEFYDMTGRLTKSEIVHNTAQNIDVRDLKRGVYSVRLLNNESVIEYKKIVVR